MSCYCHDCTESDVKQYWLSYSFKWLNIYVRQSPWQQTRDAGPVVAHRLLPWINIKPASEEHHIVFTGLQQIHTAEQSQKAVSVYFPSKLILPFGFTDTRVPSRGSYYFTSNCHLVSGSDNCIFACPIRAWPGFLLFYWEFSWFLGDVNRRYSFGGKSRSGPSN